MKKSWHPVLLTNQKRVWEVEKTAHEEKKKLDQLKKEIEEERQLAELQRLQEESTGKKRTEKLDWMYATPSTAEGSGALGGQRIGEKDMEEYLLGKKRVDEVLKQGDSIGAAHEQFIAVQNANNAQDIAAKIREDPLLAIKRQEQLAYQAMMNNPALRKQVKAIKEKKGESKEEKKERKRKEKEERKIAKKESKHSRHRYSDEEDGFSRDRTSRQHPDRYDPHHHSRSSDRRSRSPYERTDRYPPSRDERDHYGRHRERERGVYERPSRQGERDRRPSSRHYSASPPRSSGTPPQRHSMDHRRDDRYQDGDVRRRNYPDDRDSRPYPHDDNRHSARPGALDMDSAPVSSRSNRPPTRDFDRGYVQEREIPNGSRPAAMSAAEIRAQKIAQMQADAVDHSSTRLTALEERRKQDEAQLAEENRVRQQRGKVGDTKGDYVRQQEKILMGGGMDLGDVLGRRGGKGLIREDM